MKVINITTYSQRDKLRVPRILEFDSDIQGFRFKIHRHIDYPNTWLVSFPGFFNNFDLQTDNIFEAVPKAEQIIIDNLAYKADEMSRFLDDLELSTKDITNQLTEMFAGKETRPE